MGRYLKQGFVRQLEWKYSEEFISYSRMVEMMEEECIKNYKKDNTIVKKIKRFFKEVWLGFKIAEENRNKSQWGKF
jgi:hypothetical protein